MLHVLSHYYFLTISTVVCYSAHFYRKFYFMKVSLQLTNNIFQCCLNIICDIFWICQLFNDFPYLLHTSGRLVRWGPVDAGIPRSWYLSRVAKMPRLYPCFVKNCEWMPQAVGREGFTIWKESYQLSQIEE